MQVSIPALSEIKHYQLRACIGEGGFGQVFEAWDKKLQRSVAIKLVKNNGMPAQNANLAREARLAASLQHPAFVKIHSLEDDDNSQAIVMELVPGHTLKQLLQTRPLPLAQALAIVRQIAEAMQQAHHIGLAHGDLKPSNLMREPSGTVRILDFGLAAQCDPQATATVSQADPQGTIAYMAPERLLGAPLMPQADIYALGVILYELVAGQRPNAELGGLALAAAQVHSSSSNWHYPANMSAQLVQLIRAMTAREPSERLASMQQVCEQMNALRETKVESTTEDTTEGTAESLATEVPSVKSDKRRLQLPARKAWLGVAGLGLLLSALAWSKLPWPENIAKPAPPFSEAAAIKQGLASLKTPHRPGNIKDAISAFDQVLQHNPHHAAAAAGLAMAYIANFATDNRDESWLQKADAAAQQALKLDNQLALTHVAMGRVADAQQKYALALQEYERALQLEPSNLLASTGKIAILRHLSRVDEAIALARKGVQQFPQESLMLDELGLSYYVNNNFPAAEQAFRQSIQLHPDSAFAYANLYAVLLQQNRLDDAMRVLQDGLLVRPSAMLYGNLGTALFQRGDYIAAAEAFENAVSPTKGNPSYYLNWANLADTLLLIPGRAEETRHAYRKASNLAGQQLAKNPNDFTLVSRQGLYAARLAEKAQAETLLKRALQLAPNDANVHFRAGLAWELLGMRQNALQQLASAKKLGYPAHLIDAEPDLFALRRDPAYLTH